MFSSPNSANDYSTERRKAPRAWYSRPAHILLSVVLLFPACDDTPADAPYFEFAGGGFVFNYRLATVDYGFVVSMLRQPPSGSVLEARFEDPAGGRPLVVRSVHAWGQLTHSFRTPPINGLTAGQNYRVELRLLAPAEGAAKPDVLATFIKTFRADHDQAILPVKPLAPGPGYHQKVQPRE